MRADTACMRRPYPHPPEPVKTTTDNGGRGSAAVPFRAHLRGCSTNNAYGAGGHSMRTWNTSRVITIVAVACLAAASTTTIGCAGGGGSSNPNSSTPAPTASPIAAPTASRGTGVVSGNHPLPHVAVITAAQLSAGIGIILDISNGLHSHTVTLTGVRVSVESSTDTHSGGGDPHSHMVTFN
jgi:hypothetical protein